MLRPAALLLGTDLTNLLKATYSASHFPVAVLSEEDKDWVMGRRSWRG